MSFWKRIFMHLHRKYSNTFFFPFKFLKQKRTIWNNCMYNLWTQHNFAIKRILYLWRFHLVMLLTSLHNQSALGNKPLQGMAPPFCLSWAFSWALFQALSWSLSNMSLSQASLYTYSKVSIRQAALSWFCWPLQNRSQNVNIAYFMVI